MKVRSPDNPTKRDERVRATGCTHCGCCLLVRGHATRAWRCRAGFPSPPPPETRVPRPRNSAAAAAISPASLWPRRTRSGRSSGPTGPPAGLARSLASSGKPLNQTNSHRFHSADRTGAHFTGGSEAKHKRSHVLNPRVERVAVICAKNHKRQRRKRQSVTAKREKSQTPKVLTAILTLPNLT